MAAGGVWAALVGTLLALPAACDLPRDPGRTLREVRGGTLPVAVTADLLPAEEAVLRRLAEDLGARLEPVELPLHEAVAQLGASEPDGLWIALAAGAIPEDHRFPQEAGASRPIGRERVVLLVPPGENAFLLAVNRAVGEVAEAEEAAP